MDDVDRALEALKFHIKKEIVDNYFGDRVYLEEELALLQEETGAYRRDADLVSRRFFDVYEALQLESQKLREQYEKINTHVRLLNEDIDKFNLTYDFGLIAAQMEALEGHQNVMSGPGLLAGEREELSTRMR